MHRKHFCSLYLFYDPYICCGFHTRARSVTTFTIDKSQLIGAFCKHLSCITKVITVEPEENHGLSRCRPGFIRFFVIFLTVRPGCIKLGRLPGLTRFFPVCQGSATVVSQFVTVDQTGEVNRDNEIMT